MPDKVTDPKKIDTIEPSEEPTGPADIKTFEIKKNQAISKALLSDKELADREASEKMAADEKARGFEDISDDDTDDPRKEENPDDDHALPKDDDPFGMDDPMVDFIDKGKANKNDDDDLEKPDLQKKKEGNAGLREEVKAANSRLEEQRSQHQREVQGLNEQINSLKDQLNESSNRLAYRNPDEHPDVQAITKPWDNELNTFAKEMTLTGGDGERLRSLAPELVRGFQSLNQNDPNYNENKDQLISMIEENFPDDKKDVIRLISRGSDVLTMANEKIAEVKKTGENFEVGQATQNREAIIAEYDKLEKEYFNPSNELRQADPLNQKVLLRDLIDSDDKIKDKAERIKSFVRFAMTPLALPKQSELDGMDEEQAAHLMQRRTGEHVAAKQKLGKMIAEALLSHAMFPVLSRDLAEAQKALSDFKSNRPAPKGNDDSDESDYSKEEGQEGPGDIKEFKPQKSNLKF